MNIRIKPPLPSSHQGKLISSLAFFLCVLGQGIQPSWAEGSKQLVADGGNRPYLEWSNLTTAGIIRQNTLQVYVAPGEIVYLGSSVPSSFNNPNDIIVRDSSNNIVFQCDVNATTGAGFIDTVAKETAGPAPLATGGYTPCTFTPPSSGIYKVQFFSPQPSGASNPTPVLVTDQFPTDGTQQAGIAAWDITVARNGVAQTGRVFTNYVAMNLGSNSRSLNSKLYIQTKDGYLYETDMNGLDPFGFVFFANNRGYIDKTNNSTLYRSAGGATDNNLLFPGNVRVQDPSVPDTLTDITHYVFISRPSTETLVSLGLPLQATAPPLPQNFLFTGGTGGSGNQTFVGVGGNFSFNVASSGSYQIIIDTNTDGIYDPSTDRVLQNVMPTGFNVVLWDGKDANGVNLLPRPGNQPYNAQITTRGGEYHFPLLDAENNPFGFRITMLNPPGAFPNFQDQNGQNIGPSTYYYNDSNYTTANNTLVSLDPSPGQVATSPRNASRGINSSAGEHEFSSFYGDFKGIDTWIYFPSQITLTPLVITTNNQANVRGTKSVRFAVDSDGGGTVNVGDIVEYTVTYSNLSPGNSDAINFVITDNLPSQLTYQSAIIASATSGNNITLNPNYNGSGAVTNSGTLRVGDTITIRITARINNNNGGNPISNQASATFTTPDNTQATSGTVVTDADSAGATNNPPTLGNSFVQIPNDGTNTGNDPTKTDDDDPTLFTVSTVNPNPPKVVLVKRITRINNQDFNDIVDGSSAVPTTAVNYVAAPRDADDNEANWPANYLRGRINAGAVQPGDDIEYTIYFLSSGATNATNVKFCDLVPSNVTFVPTAFNGLTPNDGVSGADQGMALAVGNTNPTVYFSNLADSDRGTFYPANDPATPSYCPTGNTNGAVAVEITRNPVLPFLPPATSPGTPTNSYGFVRFRAKVK